jgi:hypothetical protein
VTTESSTQIRFAAGEMVGEFRIEQAMPQDQFSFGSGYRATSDEGTPVVLVLLDAEHLPRRLPEGLNVEAHHAVPTTGTITTTRRSVAYIAFHDTDWDYPFLPDPSLGLLTYLKEWVKIVRTFEVIERARVGLDVVDVRDVVLDRRSGAAVVTSLGVRMRSDAAPQPMVTLLGDSFSADVRRAFSPEHIMDWGGGTDDWLTGIANVVRRPAGQVHSLRRAIIRMLPRPERFVERILSIGYLLAGPRYAWLEPRLKPTSRVARAFARLLERPFPLILTAAVWCAFMIGAACASFVVFVFGVAMGAGALAYLQARAAVRPDGKLALTLATIRSRIARLRPKRRTPGRDEGLGS